MSRQLARQEGTYPLHLKNYFAQFQEAEKRRAAMTPRLSARPWNFRSIDPSTIANGCFWLRQPSRIEDRNPSVIKIQSEPNPNMATPNHLDSDDDDTMSPPQPRTPPNIDKSYSEPSGSGSSLLGSYPNMPMLIEEPPRNIPIPTADPPEIRREEMIDPRSMHTTCPSIYLNGRVNPQRMDDESNLPSTSKESPHDGDKQKMESSDDREPRPTTSRSSILDTREPIPSTSRNMPAWPFREDNSEETNSSPCRPRRQPDPFVDMLESLLHLPGEFTEPSNGASSSRMAAAPEGANGEGSAGERLRNEKVMDALEHVRNHVTRFFYDTAALFPIRGNRIPPEHPIAATMRALQPYILANIPQMATNELQSRRLETLNRLCAVRKSSQEDSNDKCVICLIEFQIDQDIRSLLCDHKFHKTCIDTWCRSTLTCPICRGTIGNNEVPEDEEDAMDDDNSYGDEPMRWAPPEDSDDDDSDNDSDNEGESSLEKGLGEAATAENDDSVVFLEGDDDSVIWMGMTEGPFLVSDDGDDDGDPLVVGIHGILRGASDDDKPVSSTSSDGDDKKESTNTNNSNQRENSTTEDDRPVSSTSNDGEQSRPSTSQAQGVARGPLVAEGDNLPVTTTEDEDRTAIINQETKEEPDAEESEAGEQHNQQTVGEHQTAADGGDRKKPLEDEGNEALGVEVKRVKRSRRCYYARHPFEEPSSSTGASTSSAGNGSSGNESPPGNTSEIVDVDAEDSDCICLD